MGDWPVILPILAVGYVLGRARPFRTWCTHNSQLTISAGRLGRRDRARCPSPVRGSRESVGGVERNEMVFK